MRHALVMAMALASGPAMGFCGTYVGGAGSNLYNGASQVAVVRQGSRTTLTMANDVYGSGAMSEFAMVIPVPEVLAPEDVGTVDRSIFETLDGYSAPRLVTYSCDDFWYSDEEDGGVSLDTGAVPPEPGADGVTVEASFTEGEYEIVILSAEESSGLLTWLDTNGFTGLDATASEMLTEYIESGTYFLAARVSLEAIPEDAAFLSPLRISYESTSFGLPIRLGTVNAPPDGVQNLYLYFLTDSTDGRVGISNSAYPQLTIEDECMWRADEWPDFGTYWASQVESARVAACGVGWVEEYAWYTGGCDPCSGTPPNDDQVNALGWEGSSWDTYFTRLHVQYEVDAVHQDLSFYTGGISGSDQIRYIVYLEELEDRFPICGEETPSEPGSCDEDSTAGDADTGGDAQVDDDDEPDAGAGSDSDPAVELGGVQGGDKGGCGCAVQVAPMGMLAWVGLTLGWVRRRR